jgi:hypothetical protein
VPRSASACPVAPGLFDQRQRACPIGSLPPTLAAPLSHPAPEYDPLFLRAYNFLHKRHVILPSVHIPVIRLAYDQR